MKNEILSLTCRMKILFFTWPLQVSLTFPDLSEKDPFPPDFPWPYKPCTRNEIALTRIAPFHQTTTIKQYPSVQELDHQKISLTENVQVRDKKTTTYIYRWFNYTLTQVIRPPFRRDRSSQGGGILLYVKEGILIKSFSLCNTRGVERYTKDKIEHVLYGICGSSFPYKTRTTVIVYLWDNLVKHSPSDIANRICVAALLLLKRNGVKILDSGILPRIK